MLMGDVTHVNSAGLAVTGTMTTSGHSLQWPLVTSSFSLEGCVCDVAVRDCLGA